MGVGAGVSVGGKRVKVDGDEAVGFDRSDCRGRIVRGIYKGEGEIRRLFRLYNAITGITGYLGVRFIKFSFAVFVHMRTSPIYRTRNVGV